MAEKTEINWTDHTWSPWEGCQKVGPGCDNCYAEARNQRFTGGANWGPGAPRRRTVDWTKPYLWDRKAAKEGRRARIFPSLCDPFDNAVPSGWRIDLFTMIRATPHLDWLLLTKRIGNVEAMVDEACGTAGWPANAWLGITVVNQDEADRDIGRALGVRGRLRIPVLFLSMEPLLGPVKIPEVFLKPLDWGEGPRHFPDGCGFVDWVIVGGESGPKARPMHPQWAKDLRDQCEAAGVPYLFKQHGEWAPGSGDFGAGRFRTVAVAADGRAVEGGMDAAGYPKGATAADGWTMVHWAGKKAAGRLLDGREHNEFPRIA